MSEDSGKVCCVEGEGRQMGGAPGLRGATQDRRNSGDSEIPQLQEEVELFFLPC